jgi:hypothetical protein
MSKNPATFADMRSTIFDYRWAAVGEKRGGPIAGIKELLLAEDPETGAYSRIVLFQPGFKFDRSLEHPFWEEIFVLEGHVFDLGSGRLYTKGSYGLRPPGTPHGPYEIELGATVLEITWYDGDWYLRREAGGR